MPKRKATGPVDSDGDDDGDQFYSFPSTPVNFGGGGGLHRPVIAKSLQAGLTIKNQQSCATTTAPSESSSTATRSSLSSTSGGSGNPEFVRTMRDLNKTFHNAVRSSIMKNSSNSLVPLVKDYLFHSRVLMEQFKKGGTQVGLMNGVDLPPKTLKSLGEFFDDFEMRFVENNQPETINLEAETSQETNSALISNFSPPKSTFSSNFSLSTSMPKPTTDNNNFKAPMTSDSATMKFGSLADNSTLNTTNKLDAEKSSSTSGFFTQKIPSVPNPLKVGPATKPLLDPAPPAVKPFSGFSFFAPPPPPPPSGAPPATVTSAGESQTNDEDGEEDEPPKVEITPVKEDDAVYSIRCKKCNSFLPSLFVFKMFVFMRFESI